jgi:hypothetical protein
MAETQQAPAASPPADPTSVKELLQLVTDEVNSFEAKKLTELKAELEAFEKQQTNLVGDYEKKQYPVLRQQWCDQHKCVQSLYASIQCAFPVDVWKKDWKAIIAECVCPKVHELTCRTRRLRKRKRRCQGPHEWARNEAKKHFEDAKAYLDALRNNAAGVKGILDADATLIRDIPGILSGPEPAVALYLFWFKLLPAHKSIRPDDVPDCDGFPGFAAGQTPDGLCGAMTCPKCADETSDKDDAATAHQATESGAATADAARVAPWLVKPDQYASKLFDAWKDYRKAKDTFAKKEADYKREPDDIASLDKQLDERTKAVPDEITTCLKNVKPADCCTKKPTDQPTQTAAEVPNA